MLLSLLSTGLVLAQMDGDDLFTKQKAIFRSLLEVLPQENILLHTNRVLYVSDDKICFKTYFVGANSHHSSAMINDKKYEYYPKEINRQTFIVET